MRSTREAVLIEIPAPASIDAAALAAQRPRLDSIDLLRGVVMALMVLDHTRDFLGQGALDPRDVNEPALFLTRWITHFCAPVFIFLAGMSAYLYGQRGGRSTAQVSRFLLTRGLFLVVLELTLVCFGWTFNPRFEFVALQVIWAIGWSMVGLAGLIFLPAEAIVAIVILVIGGHNLLDDLRAEQFGRFKWMWMILHEPGMLFPSPNLKVLALYPLIPWFAVMAAGYVIGPVMLRERSRRHAWLLHGGLALLLLFVALRAANWYGDPAPWTAGATFTASVLSFLNCEKYPPSLLYLAMTLGPALVFLSVADRFRGRVANALITFGRVPLLFYLAHIYLIHLLAVAAAVVMGVPTAWLFQDVPFQNKPAGFGLSLPLVYALWLAVLILLYPLCRAFAALKQLRRAAWLSYL